MLFENVFIHTEHEVWFGYLDMITLLDNSPRITLTPLIHYLESLLMDSSHTIPRFWWSTRNTLSITLPIVKKLSNSMGHKIKTRNKRNCRKSDSVQGGVCKIQEPRQGYVSSYFNTITATQNPYICAYHSGTKSTCKQWICTHTFGTLTYSWMYF